MSDLQLRQYMLLAEKVQTGQAKELERLAFHLLHSAVLIHRAKWLKAVASDPA